MLRIFFVTIHPQIVNTYTSLAVFERAKKAGVAQFEVIQLREFASDNRGSVDDRPFGGGDGMIMRPDCLAKAVAHIRKKFQCKDPQIIFTSPAGNTWDQLKAEKYAAQIEMKGDPQDLIFICGRFGGVDQRFLDRYVNAIYSLGDAVYAGGELPSLLIAESILRLIPGVLGNEESFRQDSFSHELERGIEGPQYTRPSEFEGEKVPDVLLSGDHQAIKKWRLEQSRHKKN